MSKQHNLCHPPAGFCSAEARAIEVHKYYLSEQAGHDVGFEYAVVHWRRHYQSRWRRIRLRQDLEAQTEEILRHKWIESERAGTDLGEAAVSDWIDRYAAAWRSWREAQER